MRKNSLLIKIILIFLTLSIFAFTGFLYCFANIRVNEEPYIFKDYITCSVYNINTNINKNLQDNVASKSIVAATSRGLLKKDSDGNIVPDLASAFEVKDNGIEYDFSINKDSYWSNGEKIIPKDIACFFSEIVKSQEREDIEALFCIYKILDYKNGKCNFEDTGISYSDNQLKIRLNSPNENFPDELTKIQYRIRDSLNLWNNIFDNYKKIKYSGAYYINSIDSNESMLKSLKANSEECLNNIIMKKDNNREISMAQFEIGERDIVKDPPRDYLEAINDNNELISCLSDKSIMVEFNIKNKELSINIRKYIFKLLYEAVEEYYRNNMYYIEPSEGVYTCIEKENTSLIQNRKVLINNLDDKAIKSLDLDTISIVAEDTAENRFWIQYLKTYFEENFKIRIKETFVDCNQIQNDQLVQDYDIILYKTNQFKIDQKNEENIFNQCTKRTLFFLKDNTVISDSASKLKFDWYGDISM